MTDNEITKALECCVLYKQICPETCPMVNIRQCKVKLRKKALDLINRQKAEIDRLDIELKAMRGAANSYKAEIERLNDALNATIAGQETLQRYMSTAKAEAVKEFMNRLKAEMLRSKYIVTASPYSRACNAVIDFWVEEIDNLKEMEGEG